MTPSKSSKRYSKLAKEYLKNKMMDNNQVYKNSPKATVMQFARFLDEQDSPKIFLKDMKKKKRTKKKLPTVLEIWLALKRAGVDI